jgi:uncharacterized membrane protein
VLRDLRDTERVPETLASAGVVSVGSDGRYAVGTSDRPGSKLGFSGIFWGALFGLVLHVAATGGSYGPNAGALFETISQAGVDASFQARARAALGPDTSAIGLLVEDDEAQELCALVAPYHPTVVERSLTPEQDAELARELGRIS